MRVLVLTPRSLAALEPVLVEKVAANVSLPDSPRRVWGSGDMYENHADLYMSVAPDVSPLVAWTQFAGRCLCGDNFDSYVFTHYVIGLSKPLVFGAPTQQETAETETASAVLYPGPINLNIIETALARPGGAQVGLWVQPETLTDMTDAASVQAWVKGTGGVVWLRPEQFDIKTLNGERCLVLTGDQT